MDFGLTPKFPYGELSNVFGCAAQTAARRAAPRVGKRCATKFRKSWQGSEIFFLPPLATRGQNVFRASESVAGVAARVGKNFFSKSSPKFFNEKNEPNFFLVGAPREKKKAKQRKKKVQKKKKIFCSPRSETPRNAKKNFFFIGAGT